MPHLRESNYNSWVVVDDTHGVFNSRTGSLVTLSSANRDAMQAFLRGETWFAHDIAPLIADLIKTGVIVASDTDELGLLNDAYEKHRNGDELQLTIVTSLGCNFDCPYCFEDKRPSKLRKATADAIVAHVARRPKLTKLFVTWFGGEPLMAMDELVDLSTRLRTLCQNRGATYGSVVITNGWYLDAAAAQRLTAAGVDSAQVTLDGSREINDAHRPHVNPKLSTYDRIVPNLAAAADHIDIVVRVNLDRSNAPHLDRLLANLEALQLAGRLSVSLSQITGGGLDDTGQPRFTRAEFADIETAGRTLKQLRGFGSGGLPTPISGTPCTAVNRNDLVVGPEGELWKCWDDVGHRRLIRGNLFDLADRPDPSDHVISASDWMDESPFRDDQCRSCVALPVCMGGCPSRRRHGSRAEQCGTFRHNHQRRVADYVAHQLDKCSTPEPVARSTALAMIDQVVADTSGNPYAAAPAEATPVPVAVTLGRR